MTADRQGKVDVETSLQILIREHEELREALCKLSDAIDRTFDVDFDTRIGHAIGRADNVLSAIRLREDAADD